MRGFEAIKNLEFRVVECCKTVTGNGNKSYYQVRYWTHFSAVNTITGENTNNKNGNIGLKAFVGKYLDQFSYQL